MDYLKIYNNIINRGKDRNWKSSRYTRGSVCSNCYTETHHIKPKCIGGDNKLDNLVVLTAKEHFLCHYLLTKIYSGNDSIIVAFSIMCNRTEGKTGKDYSIIRESLSRIQSERSKIYTNTPEHKARARNVCIKRNTDPEFIAKCTARLNEPEIKLKFSNKSKEVWAREGYRDKHKESMEHIYTDEFREKRSIQTKEQNKRNPELKAKRIAAITREHNSIEHNRKIGEASKRWMNYPEYKEKYRKRMIGGNNPLARKVINYKTGEIFDTIKSAAEYIGMNLSTFKKYLKEKNFDKLDFLYYSIIDEEVDNEKNSCKIVNNSDKTESTQEST